MTEKGYNSSVLETGPYNLFFAYPQKGGGNTETVTVVIEGDGMAWVDEGTKSSDPTPINPVGLKIATAMKGLYLARPCQYIRPENCTPAVWTDNRFASAPINSFNEALDHIKTLYGNQSFRLVGYSGGAYIAFVLAAERADIDRVDTVMGLLDPDGWTYFHKITPLVHTYSLTDLLQRTQSTAFHHWCGEKDTVLPCILHEKAVGGLPNHDVTVLDNASHETVFIPPVE